MKISVVEMTPFYFRLEANGRTIKVNGQMLSPPKGSGLPNHWIARGDIAAWDDGLPATETEKDEITHGLNEYARDHGLIFEID